VSAVAHIDEYKRGTFFSDDFRGEMSWNGYEHNVLLDQVSEDLSKPHYVDVAIGLGADDLDDARGIAVLDYDNDGDLDIAINHNATDLYRERGVPAKLLENQIGNQNRWLVVELVGTRSNRDAVGARVIVRAGEDQFLRQVRAGSSYAAQHTQRLYFGLGSNTQVDQLSIEWPSGRRETYESIAVNHLVLAVEAEGYRVMELNGPGPLARAD